MDLRARRTLAALGVSLALAAPAAGQGKPARSSHRYGEHTFALDLPQGYRLQSEGTAGGMGMTIFGFATEPRADGTRGMIQISLMDFTKGPPSEELTILQN